MSKMETKVEEKPKRKLEAKISLGSDDESPLFRFFSNKKIKSDSDEVKEKDYKELKIIPDQLSEDELLTIWREAVLGERVDKEIANLLSQGFELNFALNAAIYKQFAILSPEHEQNIMAALLAYAHIGHLAEAAAAGKLNLVKLLAAHLKKTGELDKPVTKGKFTGATVLAMTAELGRLNIMQALILAGADVNAMSIIRNQFYSPFQLLVEQGYWEIADSLFEAKVDPNSQWQGISAIYFAARAGYLGLIKSLIKAGADAVTALDTSAGTEQGNTPLLIAAVNGHASIVKLLAEKKTEGGAEAPYDLPMTCGIYKDKTPLEIAASQGHIAVVRILLQLKVPNDQNFKSALEEAKRNNHTTIFQALNNLSQADNLLREALEKDLVAAIGRNASESSDDYPARYAKNILTKNKKNKLGKATGYIPENFFGWHELPELSLDSVKKLHDLLEDLHLKPKDYSLARIITHISKPDVFHYLCTQGWDIHQHNQFDRDSAIICATEIYMPDRGDLYKPVREDFPVRITLEILELLLKRGANPEDANPFPDSDLYNYSYANPLHMVLRGKKCVPLVHLLIDAGADSNSSGYWPGPTNLTYLRAGYTPLHIAAKLRKVEAVKTLLKYNANIYARHSRKRLPVQLLKKTCGYSSYQKKNQEIKNCLTAQAQNHWRHITLITDNKYATAAVQHLMSVGADYKTGMEKIETPSLPAEFNPLQKTALYWLVTEHHLGFEVLPKELSDECLEFLLYQLAQHGDTQRLSEFLKMRGERFSSIQLRHALYWAAYYGQASVVEYLLMEGVEYNQPIQHKERIWTPLCVAARLGHVAVAQLLLAKGKESSKLDQMVNTLVPPLSLSVQPLTLAAAGGHWLMIKLLLTTPVKVDSKLGDEGMTGLAYAVKRAVQYPSADCLKIIKLLLSKGADRFLVCVDPFEKPLSQQKETYAGSSDRSSVSSDADSFSSRNKKNANKKMKIIDMHEHYQLISNSYLTIPRWMDAARSIGIFYRDLKAALSHPMENCLKQIFGDFIVYDLIIKLLAKKVDFPSGYNFKAPQGDQLEIKLTPGDCLRELLGLVSSHYNVDKDSPLGTVYYEELIELQQIAPALGNLLPTVLEPDEISLLEKVIKDLYQLHLQLLAPVTQRFEQTLPKTPEAKTKTGLEFSNLYKKNKSKEKSETLSRLPTNNTPQLVTSLET